MGDVLSPYILLTSCDHRLWQSFPCFCWWNFLGHALEMHRSQVTPLPNHIHRQKTRVWHFPPCPDSAVHSHTVTPCGLDVGIVCPMTPVSTFCQRRRARFCLPNSCARSGSLLLSFPDGTHSKQAVFPSLKLGVAWCCGGQFQPPPCRGWGRTAYFWRDHLSQTEAGARGLGRGCSIKPSPETGMNKEEGVYFWFHWAFLFREDTVALTLK